MLKRLFVVLFILLIGCKSEPPDSDQDGIIDSEDECPELAGTSAYQGCPAYTLTVALNPIEGGSVSPSGGQHKHGTTLSLTASPSSEFDFSSWSGDLTGTSLNASLTMLSDKTIEANFVKKKYNFSSSVEGEGTITTKVIQPGISDKYNSGTILELTANPASEWVFSEWTGDLTGNDNPKQITVDGPKVIVAVFVKKKYKMDIEVHGEGSVKTEVIEQGAANDYNSGTILKLTAEPATGWNFDRWEGDLTGNDNPKQIKVDGPKAIKAVFVKIVELKIVIENADFLSSDIARVGYNAQRHAYDNGKHPSWYYDPGHVMPGALTFERSNGEVEDFSVDDVTKHTMGEPLREHTFNFISGEKIRFGKTINKGWKINWKINGELLDDNFELNIDDNITLEIEVQAMTVEEYLKSIDKWQYVSNTGVNEYAIFNRSQPTVRTFENGDPLKLKLPDEFWKQRYNQSRPGGRVIALNFFDIKYLSRGGLNSNNELASRYSVNDKGLILVRTGCNQYSGTYTYYMCGNEQDNPIPSINILNYLSPNLEYVGFSDERLEKTIKLSDTKLNFLRLDNWREKDKFDYFKIKDLDFSNYSYLKTIDISYIWRLETLILPNSLEKLSLKKSRVKSIDFKNASNLIELYLNESPLTNLDISNNTQLEKISLFRGLNDTSNLMQTLRPSSHHLNDDSMYLSPLDFRNQPKLKELIVVNQEVPALDFTNHPDMNSIIVTGSKLNEVKNLKNAKNLGGINFSYNNLTQIDVSENSNLTVLNLTDNNLTTIDLSKNDINVIMIACNKISGTIDLSHMSTPRTDGSGKGLQLFEISRYAKGSVNYEGEVCVKINQDQLDFLNMNHNNKGTYPGCGWANSNSFFNPLEIFKLVCN